MAVRWNEWLELADPGSLERGRIYARESRVRMLEQTPDGLLAEVEGTDDYRVRIGSSSYSCDCPVGVGGDFCKHCVAVVLVAGTDGAPEIAASDGDAAWQTVHTWLESLDAARLRELVQEAAAGDDAFTQSLVARAARATGDLGYLEELVDRTLRTRRFLGWNESTEYGYGAAQLVDELADALSPETADRLLPVLERAIDIVLRVIHRADDSGGLIGQVVRRLLALHSSAANQGAPDPKRLARWLLRHGVYDEDSYFVLDVDDYAAPLGEKGVALYRREVAKRALERPEDRHVHRALQRLAVLDRDVERVIELVGGDLGSVHQHLAVVEVLLEMEEHERALGFALQATAAPGAQHLVRDAYDVACDLLARTGDRDRVVELRHEQLERIPDESSFAALRRAASGTPAWTAERAWALEVLLTRNPRGWLSAMLSEGEVDQAWDAAQSMPLDARMWHSLLRARAQHHPEDVFDGYVELVNSELTVADQGRYRQACAYLRELRKTAVASEQQERFGQLLAELISSHRRRPTLVRMLQRIA